MVLVIYIFKFIFSLKVFLPFFKFLTVFFFILEAFLEYLMIVNGNFNFISEALKRCLKFVCMPKACHFIAVI